MSTHATHESCTSHVETGGEQGLLLDLLAHLGKVLHENATTGADMMCALVDVRLSTSNIFAMIRNAVLLTNVCIGECKDGLAKLVTKTEFASLKPPKHERVIQQVETFLQKAFQDVQHRIQQGDEKEKVYKAFAIAAIRVTVMIFKKEKFGKENKKYTLQEIEAMFQDAFG